MSFGDLYTVPPGQGNAPDLPPIDLPRTAAPPRRPLQITIGGKTPEADPWAASGITLKSADEHIKTAAEPSGDSWEGSGVKFKSADEHVETATQPHRPVSAGEAFGRSAAQGATFGLYPAIAGAMSAGRSPEEQAASAKAYESGQPPSALSELHDLIKGLGRLGLHHVIAPALGIETSRETPESYTKGREEAQKALEAGREQHPYASFAGELAGAAAVPVPGLTAAAAPARFLKGAGVGAAGGAAYGAGSALSEGKDVAGIGKGAAVGGTLGAATGGLFGGLLGPRAPRGPATQGERVAETARGLGAPLPRGITSDRSNVQGLTSKIRQLPFVGPRISDAVEATQEAAGRRINNLATTLAGGATDRGGVNASFKPALQNAIDRNKAQINTNYGAVRNAIDRNQKFAMDRTQRAIDYVINRRAASGNSNPRQGLDELINVSRGATFEGAHERRAIARQSGNVLVPHAGYNKGHFNHIIKAMSADLRDMAAKATRGTGGRPATAAEQQATVRAFNEAETEFGRLSTIDDRLNELMNAEGQEGLSKVLGAVKAKTGDVELLAKLRDTMRPDEFNQLGGTLLAELGHSSQVPGQFSLSKFQTAFDDLSPRALNVLFSQQHLKNIKEISEMGFQMKRALRESSTSHSNGMIVLLDVAKDALLIGADLAAGGVSGLGLKTVAGGATTAALYMLGHWLGSPAKASSMAAWNRARIGMLGHPTPARLAAFNIASRNLANNLGVPIESVTKRLAAPAGSRAEDDQPEGRGQVPR